MNRKMEGNGNANDPKRIKFPRLLQPLDTAAMRKQKAMEVVKRKNFMSFENSISNHLECSNQHNEVSGISNCCSAFRCKCGPGDIDDCLSDIEKQLHSSSNYEDKYQWLQIRDMPDRIKTEKSDCHDEEDENCVRLKGIDLAIVGTAIENKQVNDLTKLKEAGCIANIKVARAGLAFEVYNKSVHQCNFEKLSTSPTLKYYKEAISTRRSKRHTAEDLDNKLKRAEIRRKARLAEKLDKYKTMVCKYKQRVHQIEEMDRERHEKGVKRIERQMKKPLVLDKKDWTSLIRDNGRSRTRGSRIANLLEKRQTMVNVKCQHVDGPGCRLGHNRGSKMGVISRIKSTMDISKFSSDHHFTATKSDLKPRLSPSLSLVKKQSAEHFEQPITPSPLQSMINSSPSGAGDGLESIWDEGT